MDLYTCFAKGVGGALHPCAVAKNALDDAGLTYELKTVGGLKNVPFTTFGGKREEIRRLSGQERVPILVLDDGSVITGSKKIKTWAQEHAAA
ncbi:MAG: glutathione S-transferase N-terminal domain-containing protein [Solirubrobacteraceae bacterium]|nr:glutathione S-transferase N-terminal domain-containing protein [Solirubrobacteraceae bacterium]